MADKSAQEFANWPVAGKAALGVLIAGAMSAGYYFGLHQPLTDEIASADAQYVQLVARRQQAQERHREYLRVRTELDARSALDRQNRRVLPERAEVPAFLQDLNRLAELSGLRIELVEPRAEDEEAKYVKVPVQLRLKGGYHQLVKFFYNVSRLDRAISMENIRLVHPTVNGEDVVLEVFVLATTYRLPEQQQPAAAVPATTASAAGVRR